MEWAEIKGAKNAKIGSARREAMATKIGMRDIAAKVCFQVWSECGPVICEP